MKSISVCLCVALSVLLLTNLVSSQVIPIPGDCTRYQVCDYSGCFIFNCGIGTEFNPRILVCDYPLRDRGSCGGRGNLGLLNSYPGNLGPDNAYPGNTAVPGNAYPGNSNAGYPGNNVVY